MAQFYIPDVVSDDEIELTFKPSGYNKLIEELFRTRTERDTAIADKANADRRIGELIEQGQIQDDKLTKAQERISELTEQSANADEQVITLTEQLRLATNRINELVAQGPTPAPAPDGDSVWPDEPPFSFEGLAAYTIEKGQEEPSKEQYTRVREALIWAWDKKLGVNAWRGHLNLDEVKEHLKAAPGLGNLPQLGQRLKMHFIADTVDVVVKSTDNPTLKIYLEGLEKLKARALVFNDADQYPLFDLQLMLERVRAISKLPIILSLRGSANVATYKKLGPGIYVEIQTFGNVSEMKNTFLPKAADVDLFCLAAFKALTAAQLKAIYDTVLTARQKPKGIFFYTDTAVDWPAMPQAEVDILKSFVTRWRAAV
jgi:hypothetical protein